MAATPKIIVLDDDPTGSQTVHGCLLLMRWDLETLVMGLQDESPLVFVLTNTRSMTPQQANQITREVCRNLHQAIAQAGIDDFLVVSRSDSTLRGHYPVETDAIADEMGPFDAHFMTPAFFEGGRITRGGTHYLKMDGEPVPVHKTEFAQDSVFGYSHSYLPDYVEEKTSGRIAADQVGVFQLDDIRQGTLDQLMALSGNQCVAVDAETQADLDRFAQDVLTAAGQGKRFLFRSAASLLTALANLPPQPVSAEDMAQFTTHKSGAVLVGSHVQMTTKQLYRLLEDPDTVGVEVAVARLVDGTTEDHEQLLESTLSQAKQAHRDGKTPVIYTSRQELTFSSTDVRLTFGTAVSALLMDVVRGLPPTIGYLISKGGITSNDVLSTGLSLGSARLLGQILPGCSIVRTPETHSRFPNLPVVLFPGNVGDVDGLLTVYQRLR